MNKVEYGLAVLALLIASALFAYVRAGAPALRTDMVERYK